MSSEEDRRRVRDIVVGSRLFFSSFGDLNDPFEGRAAPDFTATRDAVRSFWVDRKEITNRLPPETRQERIEVLVREASSGGPFSAHEQFSRDYTRQLGVCSFSESGTDIPMWSYYADGHRGVCLRFVFNLDLVRLMPELGALIKVDYSDEFPRPHFYLSDPVSFVRGLTCTKSKGWSHEQEWRFVRNQGKGLVPFPGHLLDAVIVGECAPQAVLDAARDMVADREDRAQLYRALAVPYRFELQLVSA